MANAIVILITCAYLQFKWIDWSNWFGDNCMVWFESSYGQRLLAPASLLGTITYKFAILARVFFLRQLIFTGTKGSTLGQRNSAVKWRIFTVVMLSTVIMMNVMVFITQAIEFLFVCTNVSCVKGNNYWRNVLMGRPKYQFQVRDGLNSLEYSWEGVFHWKLLISRIVRLHTCKNTFEWIRQSQ